MKTTSVTTDFCQTLLCMAVELKAISIPDFCGVLLVFAGGQWLEATLSCLTVSGRLTGL